MAEDATPVGSEVKLDIVHENIEGILDDYDTMAKKAKDLKSEVDGVSLPNVMSNVVQGVNVKMQDSVETLMEEANVGKETLLDQVDEKICDIAEIETLVDRCAESITDTLSKGMAKVEDAIDNKLFTKVSEPEVHVAALDNAQKSQDELSAKVEEQMNIGEEAKIEEEERIGTPQLIDEVISEIKDAFKRFDYSQDGTISSEDLGNVLRCLGMNPSLAEIGQVAAQIPHEVEGRIKFGNFVARAKEMLNAGTFKPLGEEKLLEAFQVLDKKGTGYLTVKQFKNLMTQIGEPLSEVEIDEMLAEATNKAGYIDYQRYVKKLII